jgi:two-component sensor histidine kinase/ligand-binding sensor protein
MRIRGTFIDGEGVVRDRDEPFAAAVDAQPVFDLTPELRAELLDPESWSGMLELYARTMKLAVALVDADERMVGVCHNPQPIWTLARNAKPVSAGSCPFCLEMIPRCTAAMDALRSKTLLVVHDSAGFAHVTVPLVLGDQPLGTLFAGQILDQYAASLSMERLARSFALAPQQVWQLARRQTPMSQASLAIYGELLRFMSQTFLRDRHSAILERKSTEKIQELNQHLRRNVTEKEILLREVHHRVKNNLQIISSLLNMQSESLKDEIAVSALQDTRGRVLSMALIHEQLYSSTQWEAIDFEVFTKTLVGELLNSFGDRAKEVVGRFNTSQVLLSVDQAIPCGLILSELVTNLLKYAYPNGIGGDAVIGLSETPDGFVTLSVCDQGVGLPPEFDLENPKSMGLEIVSILAKQLDGTLTAQLNPGAHFEIKFLKDTQDRSLAASAG